MKRTKFDKLESYTSAITAVLVYILAILQYKNDNPYWWIILIAAIFMTANAYMKYKKFRHKWKNKLG